MKLNLQTNNSVEERIKKYLEDNASETLADKINNGSNFVKDDKNLINKKTLTGFMKYANDEARKLAEKGSNYACIEDEVVFGWAIHYFEEESIEEKLYNLDGTEYIPPKPVYTPKPATIKQEVNQEPKPQLSLFDMFNSENKTEEKQETKPRIQIEAERIRDKYANMTDDEPTEEDIKDTIEIIEKEEKKPISPVYQKYLDVQAKYPNSVIAYRLGDFFEVFGDNAKLVAEKLDLTLTGRDCGLKERVAMIGFPYHVKDKYFDGITEIKDLVIVDGENITVKPQVIDDENVDDFDLTEKEMREFDGDIEEEKHWVNDTTYIDNDGIVHEVQKNSMDSAVIAIWKNLLGAELTI